MEVDCVLDKIYGEMIPSSLTLEFCINQILPAAKYLLSQNVPTGNEWEKQ